MLSGLARSELSIGCLRFRSLSHHSVPAMLDSDPRIVREGKSGDFLQSKGTSEMLHMTEDLNGSHCASIDRWLYRDCCTVW